MSSTAFSSISRSCGRDSLWSQAMRAIVDPREMAASAAQVSVTIAGDTELAHQAAAQRIDIDAVRIAHVRTGPDIECRGEAAMPFFEEWPAQVLERIHQLPSNTGLALATKAR